MINAAGIPGNFLKAPMMDDDKVFDVVAISQALVDVTAYVSFDFLQQEGLEKGITVHVSKQESDDLLKKLTVEKYSPGSTAANTLCGLACLGGQVAYISRVSEDVLGGIFERALEEEGIPYKGSFVNDDMGTGRCIVLITPDADRTMVTYLGAAHHFSAHDYDPSLLKKAKIVLIEAYQLETPQMFEETQKAVMLAKDSGAMIVLSSANPMCLRANRGDILPFIRNNIDLFIANGAEYCALSGEDDEGDALLHILSLCPMAVMTVGDRGAYGGCGGEIFHVAPPPVDSVIDTCGAGDQFLAGLLASISLGSAWQDSLKWASMMSASVLHQTGARPCKNYSPNVSWLNHIRTTKEINLSPKPRLSTRIHDYGEVADSRCDDAEKGDIAEPGTTAAGAPVIAAEEA